MPACTVPDASLVEGATETYLMRPPMLLAPYNVPCGPFNTSRRARSQGQISGIRPPPPLPLEAPNGMSSSVNPTVGFWFSPVLMPRMDTMEDPIVFCAIDRPGI